MTAWADFPTDQDRAVTRWEHYFPAYEAHFGRFVNRRVLLLEIGCGWGGSLQLWKRYLGPEAMIVGIDSRPECRQMEQNQITIRTGSPADPDFLSSLVDEFGAPDMVLDDGSHRPADTVAAFRTIYPRMTVSGVYVIEDINAPYWDDYEGGRRREDKFSQLCKGLIDEMNVDWGRATLPVSEFARSSLSMHFYYNMAVFQRGGPLSRPIPKLGVSRRTRDR